MKISAELDILLNFQDKNKIKCYYNKFIFHKIVISF